MGVVNKLDIIGRGLMLLHAMLCYAMLCYAMLLSSAPPSLQTLLLMAMTPLVVSLLVLLGIHICFAEFDIQCPQGSSVSLYCSLL